MNIFIWTECLGCPLIGNVSINSFLKFHDSHKLNVFVFKEDIKSTDFRNYIGDILVEVMEEQLKDGKIIFDK